MRLLEWGGTRGFTLSLPLPCHSLALSERRVISAYGHARVPQVVSVSEEMEIELDSYANAMARGRDGAEQRALRQQVRDAHREFAPDCPGALMAARSFGASAVSYSVMKHTVASASAHMTQCL